MAKIYKSHCSFTKFDKSPWIEYARKLNLLFNFDCQVEINVDELNKAIVISVRDNPRKASAIEKLLPKYVVFGELEFAIMVTREGEKKEEDILDVFDAAFEHNRVFVQASDLNGRKFVSFWSEPESYFNDNKDDLHGHSWMFVKDIAEELLTGTPEDVTFCTSRSDDVY